MIPIPKGDTDMKHRCRIPAVLLALLLVCLPLTACSGGASDEFLSEITLGLWDRIILDEALHNVVSYVDAETVTYQGNTYYAAPMIFFRTIPRPFRRSGATHTSVGQGPDSSISMSFTVIPRMHPPFCTKQD